MTNTTTMINNNTTTTTTAITPIITPIIVDFDDSLVPTVDSSCVVVMHSPLLTSNPLSHCVHSPVFALHTTQLDLIEHFKHDPIPVPYHPSEHGMHDPPET